MKKELIKLANDLDGMGYAKFANKVDALLLKMAELYDNDSNWGDQKRWYLIDESSIASDFYEQKRYLGNQEQLESYIKKENIADWQKEKVIKAIKSDSRWGGGAEGSAESFTDRPVTKGELEKLVMLSVDPGNTYKMSDDIFGKIQHFIFGDSPNRPQDTPSDKVNLSDLNEVERDAIL